MSNFLKSLKEALYRVGIKEPWKMTGVRSLPDYEHYLPKGLEYRKFSPGWVVKNKRSAWQRMLHTQH